MELVRDTTFVRLLAVVALICGVAAGCEQPAPKPAKPIPKEHASSTAGAEEPGPSTPAADATSASEVSREDVSSGGDHSKPLRCDEVDQLADTTKQAAESTHAKFERFRNEVKSLGKRTDIQFDRTRWHITEKHKETCADWTGVELPEPGKNWPVQGDCTVEFQLGGDAALIYQTAECGGDACTVRHFMWDSTEPEPVRLQTRHGNFASLNVAPSKDVVVFDRQHAAPIERRIYRLNVASGQACLITRECFSPRLAPDGQTIVCRNYKSDVLEVPITGGEPKLLEPAKLPPTHTTYRRSQWGDFPPPAEFVSADRVEYLIVMEEKPAGSGEVEELERPLDWPPKPE